MAYTPSLTDLQELHSAPIDKTSGYMPSLEDIPADNTQMTQAAGANTPNSMGFKQSLKFLAQNDMPSAPFGNHPIADINAGISKFKTGAINTYDRLTGQPLQPNPDISDYMAAFGNKNPSGVDTAIAGLSQYAPYGVVAEAGGGGLAAQMGAGGLFGATQSNDPLTSAITDALMPAAIKSAFAIPQAKNALGNFILNRLNKSAQSGGALNPAEAAENLATNYSDAQGNPLPVDIGTLTNNPGLKNTYQALKYAPFSGASKQSNIVNNALADKQINDLDTQYIQQLGATPEAPLQQQLSTVTQQQGNVNDLLNKTPDFFNSLANGIENRANMTQELKGSVQDLYKGNKKVADQLYNPINESELRLDNLGVNNPFPNYTNSAMELLAKKENFENLFDTDADLGTKLRAELSKAQGLISGGQNYGVTLPEAVTRIQNLGNLAASATSQGKRYEGMLLGNLREALSADVDNTLRQSGNENLADTLQKANSYYKNNVIPFWQNNEIRKAVTDNNYIPQKAKLATALHDSNNQSILNQLPQTTQNAALYQLITGGKGTSQGVSNLTAEDIAKAYQRLPVDTKTMVSQYNPQADQLFENLPNAISQRDQLANSQKDLSQQISSILADRQKTMGKLQDQIQKAKNQKFGTTKAGSASSSLAEKLAKGAAVGGAAIGAHFVSPMTLAASIPAMMASRALSKTLVNPELVQAYINQARLPIPQTSALSNALARALPAFITPRIPQGQ